MKKLLVICMFMLLFGCGGGEQSKVLTLREPISFMFFSVGNEDNSQYSGRYAQIQSQDFFFRETIEYAMVTYQVAGSLEALRVWFHESYNELLPYWAISFAVKYTDGSVEFWLPGKITELGEVFIHPAMFFEQWMIFLNSEDSRVRHPYDWFGKPPSIL